MSDWIGYQWLAETFGVAPVQPFCTRSHIAGTRATQKDPQRVTEFYTAAMRPKNTLAGHLTFAFKHEGIHLEFLARLFRFLPPAELEAWIASEPAGQFARRACFFYEFLTGKPLAFKGVVNAGYVEALSPDTYFTAAIAENVPKYRVRNNLPGTAQYCPVVERTALVKEVEAYDCAHRLSELEAEFGPELLRKSAVWLTIGESRASFFIEREEHQENRIRRFAAAMEENCGLVEAPLSSFALGSLQQRILGEHATRYGVRRSPVFIGGPHGAVDYIAPHYEMVPELLSGLEALLTRSQGQSPIIRMTIASFGFVYIHPMTDGNGRISRFLINDTLRRDRAVPAPFILPVSVTITKSIKNRVGYGDVLSLISKPFMRYYADKYRFGEYQKGEDEVVSNLYFDAYDDALPTWRYPDFTPHVEYLGRVVRETIEEEMRHEASYLRDHVRLRECIKDIFEAPDQELDRIIRSVRENRERPSGKLFAEFPVLEKPGIYERLVLVVNDVFPPETSGAAPEPKKS